MARLFSLAVMNHRVRNRNENMILNKSTRPTTKCSTISQNALFSIYATDTSLLSLQHDHLHHVVRSAAGTHHRHVHTYIARSVANQSPQLVSLCRYVNDGGVDEDEA